MTDSSEGGPEKRPFITHPLAVKSILESWGITEENNQFVLCLALAHDFAKTTDVDHFEFDEIIEDQGFSFGAQLAPAVRSLYFEIGNNVDVSIEEYDRAKAEHLRQIALLAPTDVLMTKMADRVATTIEFLSDGRKKKAAAYFREGRILFRRIGSMPHARAIRTSVSEINDLIT